MNNTRMIASERLHTTMDSRMSDLESYGIGIHIMIKFTGSGRGNFSDDLFRVEMHIRRHYNK